LLVTNTRSLSVAETNAHALTYQKHVRKLQRTVTNA